MTAVLLGTPEVHSPEWHELRKCGIGASEIAAVAGLSPYQSAFYLWHVKKGNIPGPTTSNAMDWGNRLEPLVTGWWQEQHPDLIVEAQPGSYAKGGRPWQRCNPDGLVFDWDIAPYPRTIPDAILQVKTSRYGDDFGPSGSDQIPLHYRCQVQWEMDVLGVDHCWLAVLIGGNDPREYRIDADPEGQATLRQVGERFWQSLQTDDEPPIDASDSTHQAVKKLHPGIDPETDAELDPALYARYLLTKQDADSTKAAHQQAKSELLAVIGNARRALVEGVPVLRRQPGRGDSVSLYPIKEAS